MTNTNEWAEKAIHHNPELEKVLDDLLPHLPPEKHNELYRAIIQALSRHDKERTAEVGQALIEQIEVAILAQEQGVKSQAELLGLNKWLDGAGIIKTKYDQDKLAGQKDLLRWLKKGYFPAITTLRSPEGEEDKPS